MPGGRQRVTAGEPLLGSGPQPSMGELKMGGQPIVEALGTVTPPEGKGYLEVPDPPPAEEQNGHEEYNGKEEPVEDETPPPQSQPQAAPRKREEFWSSAPQLQDGCRR